jgi:triosephosphate isomerase
MHMGPLAGAALARQVVKAVSEPDGMAILGARAALSSVLPQVVVCPPFVTLTAVGEVLRGTTVGLGAQDLHWERQGAFTGEISGEMLVEIGCSYVIVGHSERRQLFGETDAIVARKARAALDIGLTPIICVGETLAEREADATSTVIERQWRAVYEPLDPTRAMGAIIAYEPVWAIGTGRNATPAQAVEVHAQLRGLVRAQYGAREADDLRILYGGSVNQENGGVLLGEEEIDGALVGGASLRAEEFARLIALGAAAASK